MKDVWVGYSVGHKWACSWAAVHGKYIGLVMGKCETVTVSNLLAHDWAVHHGAEGCCHSLNALLFPTNWVRRQHKIVFSVHSLSCLSHFWFLKSYSLVLLKTWYLHSLWDSTGLINNGPTATVAIPATTATVMETLFIHPGKLLKLFIPFKLHRINIYMHGSFFCW